MIVVGSNERVPLLRTSERNDFRECPWKWQQTWVEGRTTKRVPTWSWFGTAIHKGLEEWYQPGFKRAKNQAMLDAFEDSLHGEVRRVYTEGGEMEDDEVVDALELGRAMLTGYVNYWGLDKDWDIIHREQTFQIDVPHPMDTSRPIVVYAGTWDALFRHRHTKEYWLVDHKTRRSFPNSWAFYNLNDQAGSYLWVAPEVLRSMGIFKKKDKIEGIVFNCLRKTMPDTRPVNSKGESCNKARKEDYKEAFDKRDIYYPRTAALPALVQIAEEHRVKVIGPVSARQPLTRFHREEIYRSGEERVKQARRVQQEARVMDLMRRGKLEPWKHPTENCVRCILFEYCETDEFNSEEGSELMTSILRTRDPYRDHRSAMKSDGVEIRLDGTFARQGGRGK